MRSRSVWTRSRCLHARSRGLRKGNQIPSHLRRMPSHGK
jgi:hypothetical protein